MTPPDKNRLVRNEMVNVKSSQGTVSIMPSSSKVNSDVFLKYKNRIFKKSLKCERKQHRTLNGITQDEDSILLCQLECQEKS